MTGLAAAVELTLEAGNSPATDVQTQAATPIDAADARTGLLKRLENAPGRSLAEANPGVPDQQFETRVPALPGPWPAGLEYHLP